MKSFIIILLALTIAGVAQAQQPDIDAILIGDQPRPAVAVVGTFHFAYYNLDAHKTEDHMQLDILSPSAQQEVEALVQYIARFNPTKILVESGPNTGYLMRKYEHWQAGEGMGKNEREQLGFRLMAQFGMDTIYGIDAWPLVYQLYDGQDSNCIRPIVDSLYEGWDFQSDEFWSRRYDVYYDKDDSLNLEMPLTDYFLWMNDRHVLERGYGAYLVGDFKLGDTEGADALSMHWYNRNLRIYRNIQRLATSPDDRLLVIIGQGHACILDHLFRCSPEFDYVPFTEIGQ